LGGRRLEHANSVVGLCVDTSEEDGCLLQVHFLLLRLTKRYNSHF